MSRLAFPLLGCVLLTACSGTSVGTGEAGGGSGSPGAGSVDPGTTPPVGKFDALFTLPGKAAITPDSVTGVWVGWMTKSQQEVRVRIAADGLVLAMQCRTGTVGIDVAAHVSSTTIRALEGRSTSSSGYCSMTVSPFQLNQCAGPDSFRCFKLSGTTLTFQSAQIVNSLDLDYPEPTFTKLSD